MPQSSVCARENATRLAKMSMYSEAFNSPSPSVVAREVSRDGVAALARSMNKAACRLFCLRGGLCVRACGRAWLWLVAVVGARARPSLHIYRIFTFSSRYMKSTVRTCGFGTHMVPSSILGNKGARVGQKECNMPVQDPRPATEAAAAVLEEASRAQAQAKAKVTTPALLQRNNSMGEFPVDHGTINFIVHRTPSNPEFVKCRPTANKQLLVHHAWEKWGLEPYPGVLARVIGSIDGVADDKRGTLEDVVEGLIKAAHIAKGWLFSTGLDFGMAHMVGGLVARNRHVCESPLIGVAAWRTVQNKEQLEKNTKGLSARKGDKRVYADAKPSDDMDKISLQPNHTHFMLLGVAEGEDDPMDPPPGMSKEDALLAARKKSFKFAHDFEHEIRVVQAESGLNDLSQRMLFVVHGDETTLEEITTFCELGEGFVLLAAQTGGVAEAIASYVESGKASGQYTVPIGWKHAAGRFERLKELNAKKRVELQAMSTERRSGSLVAIAAANGRCSRFRKRRTKECRSPSLTAS